jgi:hypothetical protein
MARLHRFAAALLVGLFVALTGTGVPAYFSPGLLSASSARIFAISPAVGGKSTWNLDVDGDLTIPTAGTWTITATTNFRATATLWSGGGAGGGNGGGTAADQAGDGGASSFDSMSITGGDGAQNARPPSSIFTGAKGSGKGIATGGDTDTNGIDGTDGARSGSNGHGGNGAGAPDGGGDAPGPNTSGAVVGPAGTAPGGGGAGAGAGTGFNPANAAAGGGGQSGGEGIKLVQFIAGTGYPLVIGAGGAISIASIVVAGGTGAPGQFILH